MTQGRPRPKKTLTELLPVTFPMELSAVFSCVAACLLANRSGKLVPKATNVMAVTLSLRPTRHPKMPAKSPIIIVNRPIILMATPNANHPPHIETGGQIANRI